MKTEFYSLLQFFLNQGLLLTYLYLDSKIQSNYGNWFSVLGHQMKL